MEWENHASENLQTSIERRHDVPDMTFRIWLMSSCTVHVYPRNGQVALQASWVDILCIFTLLQPMTSVIKYILFVVVTFRFRQVVGGWVWGAC